MKSIKRIVSIFTGIALSVTMLVASPIAVNAAGVSSEEAQGIELGEKVKSNGMLQKESQDWYEFTTSKNENSWYRVAYTSKEAILMLNVYDEDGKEIIKMNSSTAREQLDHLKLEPEKQYKIMLEIGFGIIADATSYTLSVQELLDKASDTEEGALSLYSGIKYTGSLECVRDDDYYTFTAGASKSSVTLSAKFDKGVEIKVFNEDGTQINKLSAYDKKTETAQFNTVKGEIYYIEAYTGYYTDYNDKSSGQYILTIKSGPTDISKLVIGDVAKASDVVILNGKTKLIKGTDYTIKVGTVKAGKVTVTIKGKGNYTGTVTKTVDVVK